MNRKASLLLAAILLTAAVPNQPAPARPIAIVINGDLLPLEPPPRIEHGILLVPVRRTIEALGLVFMRVGRRIVTQVGSKTVALTIGSRVAELDGSTVTLDAPPVEITGVLYAPLRYFTDVLGAQATFDRKAAQVTIIAQLVGRSGAGLYEEGTTLERIGTVSAVDLNSDPPTITVTYNASVRTIPIARNAQIDMHDVDANVTVPGELGNVRPGDFTRIFMEKNGHVVRVEDAFGSHSGRIAAIVPQQFVLDDGHVIVPGRTTMISLNGAPVSLNDLQAEDGVTVRYNVETNEIREVLASRAIASAPVADGAAAIMDLSVNTDRPLRAGERFTVTMHATSGGAATFDIGPYVTNLAMGERQPGAYEATYTIPSGANFTDVPIIGHLSVHGRAAPSVQADRTLSASSTPPGIADFAPETGAVVNTDRPAVYVTFASAAVPVDPSSIILRVGNRDVTSESVRSSQFIQYMPEHSYPNGSIRVSIRVADAAGNVTTKSWTFTIHRPEKGTGR